MISPETRAQLEALNFSELVDNLITEKLRVGRHYDDNETSREFRRAVMKEIDRRLSERAGIPT